MKKSHGHNFNFSGPSSNQRGTIPIGKPLILGRTRKIKIVAVTFFRNTSSAHKIFLKFDSTNNTQKVPHFRNPQDVRFNMVVPWMAYSIRKI